MNSVVMPTLALVLASMVVCLQTTSALQRDPPHSWIERPCNFPPSLWCSSRRIAQNCKVEGQCEKTVWSSGQQAIDDRVQLALYYETLCPDCQQFTQNQLWPTFQKVASIINIDLIPYGNAREQKVGDHWEFTCQHGENECYGNLIQTCALSVEKNFNVTFPFIACMEMSDELPKASAPKCAKDHGVDLQAVMQCVNGSLGNQLEHKMAVQTDNLNPPHNFVPWVTLNGEHTDNIQARAESDLLGLICDTYQGPNKPAGCNQHIVSAKRRCIRN